MKGVALIVLCAVALAQADRPHLSRSGQTCACKSDEARTTCAQYGSNNELIAHENCNQFYKCSNGRAIPYFCPANLLYSPVEQICDWPHSVECGFRPIVEGETDCEVDDNDTVKPDDGNNGDGNAESGSTGTCNCNPGEAPAICAADGSDGALVAHENCNQFYKCDHGAPVVQNCPSGLLYNPYTEQCDWADKVECGDRPIVEIDSGNGDNGSGDNGNGDNGDGNGNGESGSTGTCNCNPGEAPAICAADGSDGDLVAHENCNQFYKCDHGAPVVQNCPSGLLYNPYTEQCDWADKVECGDRPIVEIDSGNGDNGSSDNGNGDNGDGNGNGESGSTGTCNCNPSEAPAICAADGSDGDLVAHENCNQFYKCDHGAPVVQNCPSGLLYNPYTEQCDWADKVECGDRPIVEIDSGNGDNGSSDNGNGDNGDGNGNGESGSTGTCNCNPSEAPAICAADGSDGDLVAHENCNQFYKCDHGAPVVQNCPSGLLYNPYTEQCDWADKVECGDRPIVEIDSGNGDNGSGNNGNGDNGDGNGNGESGSTGTCNCNPGEAPAICAADGSDGDLVAHENCNQFYKCDHGAPVVQNCPSGLLYNPYTEQCDWADKVECGDRPIVEIDSGNGDNGSSDNGNGDNGDGNGNGESGSTGTCNCNPSEAPAICAADGSDGDLVAHENCNQFYKCDHGAPVVQNCPSGLLYNPYTEQCDWADKVECGDRPIVEIDSGNGDNGSGDNGNGDNGDGNGNGESGSTGTCNCNPSEAPAICAADGSDGALVAHENCNQFYKCSEGLPVTLNCPAGLLYNAAAEWCDWPENVECGDRPIVEVEGGNNDNGDGNDNGDSDIEENNNNGANCDPSQAPALCAAPGSDGVLVAHENCNQFYKCSEGLPVTLNCPAGLLYNSAAEWCDWPENVECGDRPIVEVDGGNNGSGNGNGNGNGNGDGGEESGTCNCNPSEAPAICASNGSDGVLVAHENCNQFYKCSEGLPVTLNCPSGLLYNAAAEWCDWPENVECGDRPIVEVEGGNNDNGDGNGNGDSDNEENNNNGVNCDPSQAPALCAASGSDGVLVAHENCNQFYKCSEGLPVTLNCPAGLLYNSAAEWCDWPENVECGDRPIVEVEGGNNGNGDGNGNGDSDNEENNNNGVNCDPSQAPALCAASGSDGVLVAHENCNQFYKCSEGLPVTLNCPSGLLYNSAAEWCDWPSNVECGDRPIVEVEGGNNGNDGGNGNGDGGDESDSCNCNPREAPAICAANGSDGVLVAHENCNQFYKCSEGLPATLNCPSGLLYNAAAEWCDWPENVKCGDRPIVEVEGGNNDNGDGNGNGDSDNEENNNNGGNCDPSQAPALCAASGSDGVLVAHNNCNQFYKCSEGLPVVLDCPSGLLYNSDNEWCDWPFNVECGDRLIV